LLRVVVDTNVLVSALLNHGKPAELLARLIKEHQIILTNLIIDEFYEVMAEERFRINDKDTQNFLSNILKRSKLVKPRSRYEVVLKDSDDNMIVNAAYKSEANFIVTGDKHLLNLKAFKRTEIVNVADMLEILKNY